MTDSNRNLGAGGEPFPIEATLHRLLVQVTLASRAYSVTDLVLIKDRNWAIPTPFHFIVGDFAICDLTHLSTAEIATIFRRTPPAGAPVPETASPPEGPSTLPPIA